MEREKLAKEIYAASHITGEFLLRSGQTSNEYFDKYLFEAQPELLRAIAQGMAPMIPEGTEVIAGLEMGGIPIVAALSMQTGLPAAFVRKQAKEYGTCKLAEGAAVQGRKVCIIEDVVTTGGQIVLSVNELRAQGADIDTVLCVILRNDAAHEILGKEGLALQPLYTMAYLKEVAE